MHGQSRVPSWCLKVKAILGATGEDPTTVSEEYNLRIQGKIDG